MMHLDQIKNLADEIEVKIDDSDFEINKYCNILRKQIQIVTEEKINQINYLSDSLIKKVDNYELECKDSFKIAKTLASKEKTIDLFKKKIFSFKEIMIILENNNLKKMSYRQFHNLKSRFKLNKL